MKIGIDTLIEGWIHDSRYYIEENYELIEDWLLDFESWDNWQYDFFDVDEVDNKSDIELAEQVYDYIKRHKYGYTVEEYCKLKGWDYEA